jgi:hypothetical protein
MPAELHDTCRRLRWPKRRTGAFLHRGRLSTPGEPARDLNRDGKEISRESSGIHLTCPRPVLCATRVRLARSRVTSSNMGAVLREHNTAPREIGSSIPSCSEEARSMQQAGRPRSIRRNISTMGTSMTRPQEPFEPLEPGVSCADGVATLPIRGVNMRYPCCVGGPQNGKCSHR